MRSIFRIKDGLLRTQAIDVKVILFGWIVHDGVAREASKRSTGNDEGSARHRKACVPEEGHNLPIHESVRTT